LGEIEHVQRHFERGVDFFEVPGHFAGIAARPVGANDEGNHAGTIATKARFGKLVKRAIRELRELTPITSALSQAAVSCFLKRLVNSRQFA
jgi:hypothetical protein